MKITETIKLYLTKDQKQILVNTMNEYINTVNMLVSLFLQGENISIYTTADVEANLPSAILNQAIRDSKSIIRKYLKNIRNNSSNKDISVPKLKKPCFFINNQTYRIYEKGIAFPVTINNKTTRIKIKAKIADRQKEIFNTCKLGTMRIVLKGDKIVAQVSYEKEELPYIQDGNIMGIDLGIKCPAVSYTSDDTVKFYGNGRKNKYIRRYYKSLRKTLAKNHHINRIKNISNKESRIMKDIDHKISREIVNTAKAHNVKIIKMENLKSIGKRTRTSRKNKEALNQWSFYRLSKYIEYKAKLLGIKVEYVNPVYTSQLCPKCGCLNHAKDRDYKCQCGYHIHRDLLGAINICNSTEYVGDHYVRHTA